jgi:hypothetical protein
VLKEPYPKPWCQRRCLAVDSNCPATRRCLTACTLRRRNSQQKVLVLKQRRSFSEMVGFGGFLGFSKQFYQLLLFLIFSFHAISYGVQNLTFCKKWGKRQLKIDGKISKHVADVQFNYFKDTYVYTQIRRSKSQDQINSKDNQKTTKSFWQIKML